MNNAFTQFTVAVFLSNFGTCRTKVQVAYSKSNCLSLVGQSQTLGFVELEYVYHITTSSVLQTSAAY